jgi:hypothetical protein
LNDIRDKKGVSDPKLEHIFLGTVKKTKISGYHCDKNFGDEKVYAETRLYPKSRRTITVNRQRKLFEAVVREKETHRLKHDNGGKSTFFNKDWSRQDVVDCIDRLKSSGKIIKKYTMTKGLNCQQVCIDKKTGIVVVNNNASTFPLLKY